MTQLGEKVAIKASFINSIYTSEGFQILHMQAVYDSNAFPDGFKNYTLVDFTAKGKFCPPDYEKQAFELKGEWQIDKNRNETQFNVAFAIPALPQTEDECFSFMTRSVQGIGKILAKRVIEKYGSNLELATKDVEVLAASVKGMSLSKATNLCDAVIRLNVSAELTKLLENKVKAETINKIALEYGEQALNVVKKTPYKMIEANIPFPEVDAAALSVGFSKDYPIRLKTGVLYTLKYLKLMTSSIIIEKSKLAFQSMSLLSISKDQYGAVYKELYRDKEIFATKLYVYLWDDYSTEIELSSKIVACKKKKVNVADGQKYKECFAAWEKAHPSIELAAQQRTAVESVGENIVSIVTGGPGTGKTTVLKAIMETYENTFPKGLITLLAPTGLAAKKMTDCCNYKAKTIFKGLNIIPSDNNAGFDENNFTEIDGGLIIIDEFSMVGIHITNLLFKAIAERPNTRIVIVGDVDQLESVSPGSVLDDLIDCNAIKVTRLNRNFRQEAGSAIIDGAQAINTGNIDVKFVNNFLFKEVINNNLATETADILKEIISTFRQFVSKYGLAQTFVLSPTRKITEENGHISTKTLLSTNSLNPILRDIANPPSSAKQSIKCNGKIFREGDRVIHLKNTENAINGDIGIITAINTGEMSSIDVDFDGNVVNFTLDLVKNLDLAYALTIHKSQGCEFDGIIIPMSLTQANMLQRNLLYTGVTRAKKEVNLIGNREAIDKSILTIKTKTKKDLLCARIAQQIQD